LFQLQTVDAIVDFITESCINNNKYKKKTNYNIMGNNSTEGDSLKKTSEKCVKAGSDFLKGSKLSNAGQSCAISVIDKALPPGGLSAAKGTAKFCKFLNKVALPVALFIDTVQTGLAVREDHKMGTTRNTVETVAGIGGGWLGGYGGAAGGAALGTVIFPGVGTIVGGIIGGLTGGIGGSVAVSAITREIGDVADYDIIEIECEKCKTKFKVRIYLDHDFICPDCKKKL
jgi:hypothetical protein